MTAFLFIPSNADGDAARRVDFAHIAGLFAERDEPAPRPCAPRKLIRAAAIVLLLLMVIGDALIVTRPGAMTGLQTTRACARSML